VVLIATAPKRIHLLLDLTTDPDRFTDEPIKVFDLLFQLVEIGCFRHPLRGCFGQNRRVR
jgi:hypothetical protein